MFLEPNREIEIQETSQGDQQMTEEAANEIAISLAVHWHAGTVDP
jgi:hypothetical protein